MTHSEAAVTQFAGCAGCRVVLWNIDNPRMSLAAIPPPLEPPDPAIRRRPGRAPKQCPYSP